MFSDRLKLLRNANNLTQSQLAEKLGLSNKSVSVYEKGSSVPSIDTLCKIADYFHVSVDYLIGHSESESEVTHKFSSFRHSTIEKLDYLSSMVYKQTGITLLDVLSALIEAPEFPKILRTIYMYCCFTDEEWGIFKSGFIKNELSPADKESFDFEDALSIDFMKSVKLKFITDEISKVVENIYKNNSIIPTYYPLDTESPTTK